LINLIELCLGNNNIGPGGIPSEIGNLINLRYLHLNDNNMGPSGVPREIKNKLLRCEIIEDNNLTMC
jgi:hypothetical protein